MQIDEKSSMPSNPIHILSSSRPYDVVCSEFKVLRFSPGIRIRLGLRIGIGFSFRLRFRKAPHERRHRPQIAALPPALDAAHQVRHAVHRVRHHVEQAAAQAADDAAETARLRIPRSERRVMLARRIVSVGGGAMCLGRGGRRGIALGLAVGGSGFAMTGGRRGASAP